MVPDAVKFPVLIRVRLNAPFVEGVKAQNCQNHPADDLKPHIVPGIDAKDPGYTEIAKQQDKDIAQKNPDGLTNACPESAPDADLNQSEKSRTRKNGKCQPNDYSLEICAHFARFLSL